MKSFILLFLFCFSTIMTCQTDSLLLHKIEFSFSIGTTTSGPTKDFEKALVTAGLDQTMTGFFGPPVKHPYSHFGWWTSLSWAFTGYYNMNNILSVGIIIGNSHIGYAGGYRIDNSKMTFENIDYSLFQVVPIIHVKYKSLYFDCGPAIYITKTTVDDRTENYYEDNNFHLGIMLGGGIVYPTDTLFFGFVNVQAKILTSDELGPYDTKGIGATKVNTIDQFEANYSNTYLGVGIGMRL